MPLFSFNLHTPEGVESGGEGIMLRDVETAYLEACAAIPDISAEFMSQGMNPLECRLIITNEAGQALMEIPFTERLPSQKRPVRKWPVRYGQSERARRLFEEIAEVMGTARETILQSRAILARARNN